MRCRTTPPSPPNALATESTHRTPGLTRIDAAQTHAIRRPRAVLNTIDSTAYSAGSRTGTATAHRAHPGRPRRHAASASTHHPGEVHRQDHERQSGRIADTEPRQDLRRDRFERDSVALAPEVGLPGLEPAPRPRRRPQQSLVLAHVEAQPAHEQTKLLGDGRRARSRPVRRPTRAERHGPRHEEIPAPYAPPARFERPRYGLEGRCSIRTELRGPARKPSDAFQSGLGASVLGHAVIRRSAAGGAGRATRSPRTGASARVAPGGATSSTSSRRHRRWRCTASRPAFRPARPVRRHRSAPTRRRCRAPDGHPSAISSAACSVTTGPSPTPNSSCLTSLAYDTIDPRNTSLAPGTPVSRALTSPPVTDSANPSVRPRRRISSSTTDSIVSLSSPNTSSPSSDRMRRSNSSSCAAAASPAGAPWR